jgi:HSP20 family molecular chaperone IbpA
VLLPDRVEADGISAGLEHGVLTVRVPKAQAAQRRRIEVGS